MVSFPAYPKRYFTSNPLTIHKTYHDILVDKHFPKQVQFGFNSKLILEPSTIGKAIKHLPKPDVFYKKLSAPTHNSVFLGDGLLTANSNSAKKQRKSFEKKFTKLMLSEFEPFMFREANSIIDQLENYSYVDVKQFSNNVTMNIVGKTLLGDIFDSETRCSIINNTTFISEEAVRHINPLYSIFTHNPLYNYHMVNKTMYIRNTISDVIDGHSSTSSNINLLDTIIYSSKNKQHAIDNILTFFLAGYDTTASALAIGIQLLYNKNNRFIINNIKDEIASGIPVNDIVSLDYFVKELLRLYPPSGGGIMRQFSSQYSHLFPDEQWNDNLLLIFPIYSIHRNPEFWVYPDKFMPERWLNIKESDVNNVYLPFSLGSRNCIGKFFALLELKIILYTLILRLNIASVSHEINTICTPVMQNSCNIQMYVEKNHIKR
jgi:cytochrome P450